MPLAAFPKCFLDRLCETGEMSVDDWIDSSLELDVDGLEFYWGFTPHESFAEMDRLKRRVEAQGRSIPMMCYSPDFTRPDPRARRREVDTQKRAIEVTAELGGSYCRTLSGQRRPDIEFELAMEWVVESILECVEHAAKHEITLILENHYKDGFWNYPEFAQKKEAFLELLDRLGEPSCLGVNFDPSNAVIAGEDPIELLEAVKERVVTMHASDRFFEGGTIEDLRRVEAHPQAGYAGMLKHGVIGEGVIDYDRIFSILKEQNFQGWISIEDGDDPERGMENLHTSADFLRRKMAEYGLP